MHGRTMAVSGTLYLAGSLVTSFTVTCFCSAMMLSCLRPSRASHCERPQTDVSVQQTARESSTLHEQIP